MNQLMMKERNPLHTLNSNAHIHHKPTATYTDQRIQEIKKKYDTPNKRINDASFKENIPNEKTLNQNVKAIPLTQSKQKQIVHENSDHKIAYSSISRASRERDANNYPQISKFGIGQVQKGNHFTTLQNFFIKPTINTKLRVSQTDQNFFKTVNKPQIDFTQGIRCKDSYSKLNRRQFQDPRIDSIDKINSKIKRILDCIDHCEKEQMDQSAQKRSRIKTSQHISSSILGRSIVLNNDQSHEANAELQQTKIIKKQQFYQDNSSPYRRNSVNDHVVAAIPSLTQMRSSHSNNQFSQYLTSYKNRLNDPADLKRSQVQFEKPVPRSTSCYDKLRDSYTQPKPYIPTDELKVDQINTQITKFQHKIAELQEQKRKLNIRFKPFYYDNSPIKKLKASNLGQPTINNYISPLQKIKNQLQAKQNRSFINQFEQQKTFSKIVARESSVYPKEEINEDESFIEDQKNKCYDNFQLRKKIGERMQQRRKKIQMYHSQSKNDKKVKQTTNLINALCEQVKLDEQLRNSKNWLSQCNNPQKVANLQSILRIRGVSLSPQQINQAFNTVNVDQSDPFFSFRQEKYTIQSVADNYLKCINYWKERICHKWNKQKLFAEQNFACNFFNKSQIVIQDFVRLLNTQTGNFYRNRDVYLIYQRIKKELHKEERQKLNIDDLSIIFC